MDIKRYKQFIHENVSDDIFWWQDMKKLKPKAEELAEILIRDCNPFINEMKQFKEFMYRGVDTEIEDYEIREVRKNRRPKSTSPESSSMIDSLFIEKFGLPLRTVSVFATPRDSDAYIYGTPYLFFPIGNYDTYASDYVADLFAVIDDIESETNGDEDLMMDEFKYIVDEYFKNHIKYVLNSGVEVMYVCDKYYLVRTFYESELKRLLFGKN